MRIQVKYFDKDMQPLEFIGGQDRSNWIDLRSAMDLDMREGEYKAIPLGVGMILPRGFEALVAPRSSLFKNHGLLVTNSPGVIDETYSGNEDQWHLLVYATRHTFIEKNERIAQFRIIEHQPRIEFETVKTLKETNRGGIGSTGR